MMKHKASDGPSISDGGIADDEQKVVEYQSEEPREATCSDCGNDCSKQYTEELSDEPFHEPLDGYAAQPSSENGNGIEQSIEVRRQGEYYRLTDDPFGESLFSLSSIKVDYSKEEPRDVSEGGPAKKAMEEDISQPSTDTINNGIKHQTESVPNNSNEKKRPLHAMEYDPGCTQAYKVAKKCKPEQCLLPESDFGSTAKDIENKSEMFKECLGDAHDAEKQEQGGSSGKRRHCQWDTQPEGDAILGESDKPKRRKTRCASDNSQLKILGPVKFPDFMKHPIEATIDPELSVLKKQLAELNRRTKTELEDNWETGERSSPTPVYDALGVGMNTRAARLAEKLFQGRKYILPRLIEKDPTFKDSSDFMPQKFYKKLYVPVKEYPWYNFVGCIIGPRGNTHKRMEKETGVRIKIRGEGSIRERKADQKPDPSDNEDLHVLLEADDQKSLDEAVAMVEKLLIPVADGMTEHRLSQLKELAELNQTHMCNSCKGKGYIHTCPHKNLICNNHPLCKTCIGSSHSTRNCPLTMSSDGSNLANHQGNFLVGGSGGLAFSTPTITRSATCGSCNSRFSCSPSDSSYSYPSLNSSPTTDSNLAKQVDDANVYVGHLPQTVDENRLRELFSSFGRLIVAKVIKDRKTGSSKGFGFVKYDNPMNAAKAVAHMNGYKVDGKFLTVRVRRLPVIVSSSISLVSDLPGTAALSKDSPSQEAWPGHTESLLPEPESASIKNRGLGLPHSSIFLGHSDSSEEHSPSSHGLAYRTPISSDTYLEQFSGYLDCTISQCSPYLTPPPPINLYQQLHLAPALTSNLIPFAHSPSGTTGIVGFGYRNFMPEM